MNQDDVRTGVPIWRDRDLSPLSLAPLDGDATCDVIVIGGGITGALASYYLARSGVETLLVDKEEVGEGSTAASTGLLLYDIDTPLFNLIGLVGEGHAVQAYRLGVQAIHEFEDIISHFDHPCGFRRRPSAYFASTAAHVPDLEQEYCCRKHFGFQVDYLQGGELRDRCGIEALAAIHSRSNAEVDPYHLTRMVIQSAQSAGLRAYGHTAVEVIEENDSGVLLRTARGRIKARAAIVATGYMSPPFVRTAHEITSSFPSPRRERGQGEEDKNRCSYSVRGTTVDVGKLFTTYVTVSEPMQLPGSNLEPCLLWETARPYFYARSTEDRRMIIGGEDSPHPMAHENRELLRDKAARLTARYAKLYAAEAFRPAYVWGGTFAETKDGLPYIGLPPGYKHVYFALGYGGNGITFSLIASQILRDLIVGRSTTDAPIFRFGR